MSRRECKVKAFKELGRNQEKCFRKKVIVAETVWNDGDTSIEFGHSMLLVSMKSKTHDEVVE